MVYNRLMLSECETVRGRLTVSHENFEFEFLCNYTLNLTSCLPLCILFFAGFWPFSVVSQQFGRFLGSEGSAIMSTGKFMILFGFQLDLFVSSLFLSFERQVWTSTCNVLFFVIFPLFIQLFDPNLCGTTRRYLFAPFIPTSLECGSGASPSSAITIQFVLHRSLSIRVLTLHRNSCGLERWNY